MSKLTPEDVVLRYSKRGMNILKKYLKDGYCRTAAEKASSRRAWNRSSDHWILCGWLCRNGWPSWHRCRSGALNQLGFHSVVITDKYCKGFLN